MQRGVRRTTSGRHHRTRILERGARYDVPRQRTVAHHRPHQRHASASHERGAFAVHGGNHARPDGSQSQCFRHHAHRVRRELTGARSRRGQARMRDLVQIVRCRFVGEHLADHFVRFTDVRVASAEMPRQRGAAVHEHAGHVAAHDPHHEARKILVAAADREDAVPLMPAGRRLHAVGDDFARHQREAHAAVRDRQSIRHRRHRTLMWHTAGGIDTGLRVQRLIAQQHVARTHLAARMKHPNVRTRDFVIILPERLQKRAGGRAQHPLVDVGRAEALRHAGITASPRRRWSRPARGRVR